MSSANRSESLSPEKMQGNPPALDLSKFGSCGDLFAASDPEGSILDKTASPLSNPNFAVCHGSPKILPCIATANPKVVALDGSPATKVSTPVKTESILPATPRSSRARFVTRRSLIQREFLSSPRQAETDDKQDNISERAKAAFTPDSKISALGYPAASIDTSDPQLSTQDVQRLQQMLQVQL
jgi:hypothetical protein